MSEAYPYQKGWQRYRLRLRLWLATVALLFVFNFLLFGNVFPVRQDTIAYVILFLWLVVIGISLSVMFWKCPRCRRIYFGWWKGRIDIASDFKCRFCGLKKYEGSDIKSLSKKFGKRFGF